MDIAGHDQKTLLQLAKEAGKATGDISTAEVQDATLCRDDPQHHAQVCVLVQVSEGLGQRGDHAVVEGVAHVRAVEPDLGHMGRRPADVENRFTHGVDGLQ